ncbi:hypothetical protein Tco_1250292 [Tanacetum coccineum]
MRNLGRPNNRYLGYVDAEVPKYINKKGGQRQSKVGIIKKSSVQPNFPSRPFMHGVILIGQNGLYLLWYVILSTKSIKCFPGESTLNICNGTHDGRKELKNLT